MLAGRSSWVATVHNVLIKVMLVCCSGGQTEARKISFPPKHGVNRPRCVHSVLSPGVVHLPAAQALGLGPRHVLVHLH